jgi:hypothetical protein
MDPIKSSYSFIPTTELDGNTNIADLWPSNNGSYIQQISNHNNNNNIQQISPNNPSLQPPPGLGYARRYAASKPPYSCKFSKKNK